MTDYQSNSAALKLKPFEKPISSILSELTDREGALDDLMVDPSGFMLQRISPNMSSKLPRTTVNAANKFLFSALSNEPFRNWLFEYNNTLIENVDTDEFAELDDVQIRKDLADALLKHGDPDTIAALISVPQTPIIPGLSENDGCCCKDDDSPYPIPDPFGPTPVPESAAVAVAVLVVAVVSVAVAALAVAVADTPDPAGLKSNRMKAFSLTGNELLSVSEALMRYSERMRAAGKI